MGTGTPPGQQDTEEGVKECLLAPEHECDGFAWPESARPEPGGDGPRALPERAISDRLLLPVLRPQKDMDPLRRRVSVPGQHLGKGPRRRGSRHPTAEWRAGKRHGLGLGGLRCRDRAGEVPWSPGIRHDSVGQTDPEDVLQAQEQLDPLETPDAEVTIERVVELDSGASRGPPSSATSPPTMSRTCRSMPARSERMSVATGIETPPRTA